MAQPETTGGPVPSVLPAETEERHALRLACRVLASQYRCPLAWPEQCSQCGAVSTKQFAECWERNFMQKAAARQG